MTLPDNNPIKLSNDAQTQVHLDKLEYHEIWHSFYFELTKCEYFIQKSINTLSLGVFLWHEEGRSFGLQRLDGTPPADETDGNLTVDLTDLGSALQLIHSVGLHSEGSGVFSQSKPPEFANEQQSVLKCRQQWAVGWSVLLLDTRVACNWTTNPLTGIWLLCHTATHSCC